ncbi:hypothetical protein N7457_004517 [Penicillium paradoxum]|uniref:uncharacterized protein n=1 Tax=Penicillium paradoxum TaxID=176176 RepID=UPI002547C2D9|nr:uncharacterized protein N7457_004517 [Penicillium paradoxum]KAJ5782743.1 hypothetical protein N7457_004517 [Penicillium paradoxum]
MDIMLIQSLLEDTKRSIDLLQSSGKETHRINAQEKAIKLSRALEHPRTAILKLCYTPTIVMAIKVAHDMDIFSVLATATVPVSLDELAAAKPADPQLVERMMRLLVANGFANEPSPLEYLPTILAKEMTQRTSIAVMESLFLEFLPLIQKIPAYLEAINYRNPDDPMYAPLQYTHGVQIDGFTWLCQNPAALTRFNSFMEGHRADRPHWGDWFPVQEQILNHPGLSADKALMVDIGAGRGHDLIGFRQRFPDAPGKLVLEDLPSVIDEVRGARDLDAAGIQTVGYDFFAGIQPVHGARVYYFKTVLHDWSDEKARVILRNLIPAMKRGYSKIICEEHVLPDSNAPGLPCMTDIAVMAFCSGLERTRKRWIDLFTSVGLQVSKFWVREGDGFDIVEAELPEVEQ